MNRFLMMVALVGLALTTRAYAADETEAGAAKRAADDALASKADVPATPPTLPSQAAARATYVHDNIAFGKKGEAERAAHAEAAEQGEESAQTARADAANRAAHGAAAAAARSANADSHAAAGQARATEARTSHAQPTSLPTTTTTAPTLPTSTPTLPSVTTTHR